MHFYFKCTAGRGHVPNNTTELLKEIVHTKSIEAFFSQMNLKSKYDSKLKAFFNTIYVEAININSTYLTAGFTSAVHILFYSKK